MRCGACTASAPEGSRFCPSCGCALTGDDLTQASGGDAGLDDVTRTASAAFDDVTRASIPLADAPDVPYQPGAFLNNRYRIVRELGRGGMGAVYLADDERLGQPVALKFLPPALARHPRRLAQFQNEVKLSRQISHPNVCRVYDIGDADGHLFLSMEYIEGEDLAARLRRAGAFDAQRGVDLAWQICAGLAAVHASGVLHRDLKPANVMLAADGQAKLMDFGIATAGAAGDVREGTPAYMAPEQLLGQQVTAASDIYALGLVIHEIFTGRRVFDAMTPADLISHHTSATGLPPDVQPVPPRHLQQGIGMCLERDPAKRPASAQAVAALLGTVILDAHTVWRRLAHNAAHGSAAFLAVAAWQGFLAGALATGLAILAVAAVLAAIPFLYPVGWTVTYKGHRVRFANHPIWGERLYIDDTLADRGRLGMNVTMRGTIERGAGAGERITAQSKCTFVKVSCRIAAESFGG